MFLDLTTIRSLLNRLFFPLYSWNCWHRARRKHLFHPRHWAQCRGGWSGLGPVQRRQLSSPPTACSGCVGTGLSSALTTCYHIITAFPSSALLNMLSKMFCHVLTESVASIIHNANPPFLPSCLVAPPKPWFITHYIVPSTDPFIIVTYMCLVMRYTW